MKNYIILILILILLLIPFPVSAITQTEQIVLEEINKARIAHHIKPLTISNKLEKSAYLKGAYMKKYHFFDHNWNGLSWLWWIRKFHKGHAGENISYTLRPKIAVREWLKSPSHKANILNPKWTKVGSRALIIQADKPYIYGGTDIAIITHFGM